MTIDITGYRYTYPEGQFEHRVKKISFGNGYEQRQEDGLNPRRHSWDVTFPAFTEVAGRLNDNLDGLMDALLTSDIVLWISPYDLMIARSRGTILPEKIYSDLTDLEKENIRNTYSLDGTVSYTTLNDRLTSIKCRLKRFYGKI